MSLKISSFSCAVVMTGSLAPKEAHLASASAQEKPKKQTILMIKN